MTNASIIGFLSQEKIAEFKELLGDRFIAPEFWSEGISEKFNENAA